MCKHSDSNIVSHTDSKYRTYIARHSRVASTRRTLYLMRCADRSIEALKSDIKHYQSSKSSWVVIDICAMSEHGTMRGEAATSLSPANVESSDSDVYIQNKYKYLLMQCPQRLLHRTPLAKQCEQLPPLVLHLALLHSKVVLCRLVLSNCKSHSRRGLVRENSGGHGEQAVEGGRGQHVAVRMRFCCPDGRDGV